MSAAKPTSEQVEGEPLEYPYTTSDGERRSVVVGVDSIEMTGTWSVYDVPVGGKYTHGWLVERLAGNDEKVGEAIGLAAEYAADQQRFNDQERGEQAKSDPLSRPIVDENGKRRPVEVPLSEIRENAALARQQTAPDPQPAPA
jgi:hypothetical protein